MGVTIKKGTELERFVQLVEAGEKSVSVQPDGMPDVLLCQEPPSNDLQFKEDIARLQSPLRIACVVNAIPERVLHIFAAICEGLTKDKKCYVSFSDQDAWISAVRWAIPRADRSDAALVGITEHHRELHVGKACRRLSDRGYHIEIDTNGPLLGPGVQTAIAEHIGKQIARAGGATVLQWICSVVKDRDLLHDGLWLLGNQVGNYKVARPPEIPIGWLFAIAMRHIHRRGTANISTQEAQDTLDLTIDYATTIDCQRYNQFDGMNLHAVDFVPVLEQSLKWRELFSLPQVPPLTLATLREAFAQAEWPAESDDLRFCVKKLLAESERLLTRSKDADVTSVTSGTARQRFPLLWRHSRAEPGTANAEYLGPFEPKKRNHDRIVFFETEDGDVMVLPRAMTTSAALITIFELIWSYKLKGTNKFVGDVFEKAIYIACKAKSSSVYESVHYHVGKANHEIDVAAKVGNHVLLIETKAKMLTSKSRTVDMIAFLKDYTDSYLRLLKQLVQHDRSLTEGLTPLTTDGEDTSELRVTKVAVSPLSFGPSSDSSLASVMLCAVANARFESLTDNPDDTAVVAELNTAIEEIMQLIPEADRVNLFGYMMGVIWLDIGQLLYVIKRCRSLDELLSPIRNVTTGSQDFWTEVANADRSGFSKGRWYSPG